MDPKSEVEGAVDAKITDKRDFSETRYSVMPVRGNVVMVEHRDGPTTVFLTEDMVDATIDSETSFHLDHDKERSEAGDEGAGEEIEDTEFYALKTEFNDLMVHGGDGKITLIAGDDSITILSNGDVGFNVNHGV